MAIAAAKGNIMDKARESECCVASAAEFCYLTFILIMSALKALGFYEGQTFFTLFMVVACVFLLGKIALTKHSTLEYVFILAFLGMGGLVYLNTGEKSLLINLMVLVGIKGVSLKKAMRASLTAWGLGYTVLTLLSLTGVASDVLYMHNKYGVGYVICHSLGYAHSNVLHINYLCICAMILFLAKDRLAKQQKIALLSLLVALDIYVFLYSMSFTGLLASLVFYIIYLYVTFREKLNVIEKVLAQAVLPFCLLFSLVGPLVIKGRLFDIINNALNTRYNLTRWFFTEQPITLFGTRMEVPNYRYTLDCSYAYLFMQLGVIPFIILILLYFLTIHRLIKQNRLTELSIMLGLCVAGVTEPFLFNLAFKNITLFFVGEYLYHFADEISLRLLGRKGKEVSLIRKSSLWEKSGFSEISNFCAWVCTACKNVLLIWMRKWKKYTLIALIAGILVGGLFFMVQKPAEVVYINSSVNEEEERTPYYLSESNVEELRKNGNFVYGYIDEEEKMYPYYGSTATIEYVRIIISGAVWSMFLVCFIAAFLEDRTAKCGAVPENQSMGKQTK